MGVVVKVVEVVKEMQEVGSDSRLQCRYLGNRSVQRKAGRVCPSQEENLPISNPLTAGMAQHRPLVLVPWLVFLAEVVVGVLLLLEV